MKSTSTMQNGVLTVKLPVQDYTFAPGAEDVVPNNSDVQKTDGNIIDSELPQNDLDEPEEKPAKKSTK